jgi:outer membrane protein assembly factor BamB
MLAGALLLMEVGQAQFGRGVGDYSTTGADAQRSSWVRSDPKISRESLQKPGFELVWKVKLNNEARQLNALTPATLLTGYIGYRGFRSLGYVGGSADKIFAMDTDLGRIEWQKSVLASGAASSGSSATCPGGMTANVARMVPAAFPAAAGGFGGMRGRGGAAKSDVGQPGEGAVTVKEIAARNAQAAAMPPMPLPNAAAGRRGAAPGGGGGGFARMPNYLYAISSDGMLHSMYVSNGEEPGGALKFLPPNANAMGLIVIDNVAYAATAGGCGGAPEAVWSLDLASGQVASWKAPSGRIAGSAGPAFGPDGTLYVATDAGELAAMEPKTLKVKEVYKAGQGFASSPVVFQFKDKTLIAATAKDGRLHVVDSAAMGGAAFQSAAVAGPAAEGTSLASWQDGAGTRYLLATTASGVASLKLVERGASAALEPAWTSRDLMSPLTPLIVNGVVFAASGGQRSTPAVLYALDGTTGKELWNSGKTITSFVHGGGVSGGGSQVYLGTHDGTLYAFGFPIEH